MANLSWGAIPLPLLHPKWNNPTYTKERGAMDDSIDGGVSADAWFDARRIEGSLWREHGTYGQWIVETWRIQSRRTTNSGSSDFCPWKCTWHDVLQIKLTNIKQRRAYVLTKLKTMCSQVQWRSRQSLSSRSRAADARNGLLMDPQKRHNL